ncbi:hypothetical protein N7445_004595 [Penicillium cf. griseofulvum]|nr:hypothetical protein N7445_004595 [Penicillium cf. griseofulvum]
MADILAQPQSATPVGAKRKRPVSPVTIPSRRLRMDELAFLREFAERVEEILRLPDPQDILHAVRALAEGKEAILRDGTTVEQLPGFNVEQLPGLSSYPPAWIPIRLTHKQ